MNSFSRRLLLLLVSTATALTGTSKTAIANPGDLIAHRSAPPVVTSSTVTTYRVSGWERDLTSVTPNLSNYYWEPMTKRIVNTTRTTSRGAVAAPPLQIKRGGNYVRPIEAKMPTVVHPVALSAVPGQFQCPTVSRTTGTVLRYSSGGPSRVTQDTSVKLVAAGRYSEGARSANVATKESVYGVLVTR